MTHAIPPSSDYTGHSRTVLRYTEMFNDIVGRLKQPDFSDADWAKLEQFVDTENFERIGVFLTPQSEVIGWDTYLSYVAKYGGATRWEATLRGLTESGDKVVQELEERNTRDGVTDISNTVMIYRFNPEGKIANLDVYVMPIRKQPAS